MPMTRTWKNLCLIAFLSILQSIAPLVHAHVNGNSHSSGIHFHSGNIQFHLDGNLADRDSPDTGKSEWRAVNTEFPAIGMTQGYKDEYIFLLTDIHESPHVEPPHSSLIAVNLAMTGQIQNTSIHFPYSHPPAQAPPLFL